MNEGFKNEYEIADYLNRRRVKDLSEEFLYMIDKLYGEVSCELIITSYVDLNKHKYDIVIFIDRIPKRVSIKKGAKNSVHTEELFSFIKFLSSNGVEREYVDMYLRYHYADGTLNGTGSHRISAAEYKLINDNQKELDLLNIRFNDSKLIAAAIDKFVLRGKKTNKEIDGLLYGTKESFFFMTRDEIKEVVTCNRNKPSSGPHISIFQIQTFSRNLKYNNRYESYRHCVQIKWYNIIEDYLSYFSLK